MLTGVIVGGLAGLGAGPTDAARTAGASGGTVVDAGLWFTLIGLPVSAVVLWKRDVIRPGSLRRAGVRVLPPWPWAIWLVGALLVFLVVPVGGGVAAAAFGVARDAALMSPRDEAVVTLGGYAAALGASLMLLMLQRSLMARDSAGWLGARGSDLWRGAVAFVAAMPFVNAVNIGVTWLYVVFSGHGVPDLAHSTLSELRAHEGDPAAWVVAGAAVLLAPVVEEVMYRAMLQTALLRLTGRAWLAVLGASVVFGASHVSVVPWYALPVLAALGGAIGWAYERTGSLGVPIVMHVLFNAVNLGLAVLV